MLTLSQIKKKLNDLQVNHLQLNSFYFGELYNLPDTEIEYPLMACTLMQGGISKGIQSTKMMLLFCDLVNKGEENKTDVLSDTQQIALDIFAQLHDWANDEAMELEADAPFYDFTDRFNDEVSGWVLEITLNQFYERNACQVPGVSNYLVDLAGNYIVQLDLTGKILIR